MNKLLLAVNQSDYNRDLEQIKSLALALYMSLLGFKLLKLKEFYRVVPYALSVVAIKQRLLFNDKEINKKYDRSISKMNLTKFER